MGTAEVDMSQPEEKTLPTPPQRRRGRPPGSLSRASTIMTRDIVLDHAFQLTKTEKLDALSMIRMSTELGVSPALVHYYVEGRDDLTSGVVNRFFKAVIEASPDVHEDCYRDIRAVATASYITMLAYPGVVDYLSAHNRFRLVQKVRVDETDFGVLAFERMASATMRAGLSRSETAMFGHLLRQFILSSAQSQTRVQTPGFNKEFLDETLTKFSKAQYPGLHFTLRPFAGLNGDNAFKRGLKLLLDGFISARSSTVREDRWSMS